jgi:hypothetical protein
MACDYGGSLTQQDLIKGERRMQATTIQQEQETIDRYARSVAASKRVRWSIDEDVIRNRTFDTKQKFLPDGLSKVKDFVFLSKDEQRYLSQVQGRTYANIFGLAERYINAKVLELSVDHFFGDQTALEAMVRFSDEELKHQELFRRIEKLAAETMPPGYQFSPQPNEVAHVVLGKCTWAVLALTLHIELFTQMHYRQSIEPDENLSPLFKDVFLYHWKEESQHAILDELELIRYDRKISDAERDRAVGEFIELVDAIDGILQMQAVDDSRYFAQTCGRRLSPDEQNKLETGMLRAYRWQYILSGAQHPHFIKVLSSLITDAQAERIQSALATLM